MNSAMVVPSSPSTSSENRGLSDDEELLRAGLAGAVGLGEELVVDYGEDFVDLGFVPE